MHEILALIYGGLLSLMLKFLQCLMKPAFSGVLWEEEASLSSAEFPGWQRGRREVEGTAGCFFIPSQSRLPLLFKIKGDNWAV